MMNLPELKNQLKKAYPYRIELHAHTAPASSCSEITPKKMAQIYHSLGFHGVTIANHFMIPKDGIAKKEYIDRYLHDYEETKAQGDALGLRVYLGAEIRFTENVNDYLIFGINRTMLEEIYDLLPYGVENFRREYPMSESVFLQAHPMRKNMERVDPSLLDGVEVFNMHPNHNSRVGLVSSYAKEHGISMITAGSDFHHPDLGHEGLGAIRIARLPRDSFDLASLLKEENYLLEFAGERLLLP